MIHPALPTPARTAPRRTAPRRTARIVATALGATGLTAVSLAMPGAASAHVTVSSPDAAPGGYAKVVLRVPNESETAATTRVVVTLPEDAPFGSVRTASVPGWRASITERTLDEPVQVGDLRLSEVPAQVTWTATGGGIPVDQFGELALSVGPLPEEPGDLTFSTRQEYADGEVSDWSEPTPESGEEPEKPAPVLVVADGGGDGAATGAHGGAQDGPTEEATTEASASGAGSDGSGGAGWTGPAGLVLGAVGAGLGGVALARTRRDRPGRGQV